MPDVLMIFGSKSDSVFYDALAKEVKKLGISFELRICSAHRTPKELVEILHSTNAKVIVAGAGLSAALPGAIASHTLIPVIGVPLDGNYSGFDALLSVHQMPPGIPVLGTGVGNVAETAKAVRLALGKPAEVVLIFSAQSKDASDKAVKAEQLLKDFGAPFGRGSASDLKAGSIGINLFDLESEEPLASESALVINVPLAKNDSAYALKLLSKTKKGLFVGLGRTDNAALFALQLMGGKETALSEYRKKTSQKVIDDDKAESERVGLL